MPKRLRNLTSAHKVLAGASVLAVVGVIIGFIAAVIEIIDAPAWQLLRAAGVVIVAVSVGWLIAVIRNGGRDPDPEASEHKTAARANHTLGYVSVALLAVGSGVVGWDIKTSTATPSPPSPPPSSAPASSTPAPTLSTPAPIGMAKIDSPRAGEEIISCSVDMRFHGQPSPGMAFLAATKQAKASYYFEADVKAETTDEWFASVQAGTKNLTADEKYTLSVYELDKDWIDYLRTVMSATEAGATYWSSATLPPTMSEPLHSVNVERIRADPDCPT